MKVMLRVDEAFNVCIDNILSPMLLAQRKPEEYKDGNINPAIMHLVIGHLWKMK